MSDLDLNAAEDDITIIHDIQLHDEDGNPYALGSPPQFQFFSESTPPTGSVGASTEEITAGPNVALKTAYDHVRSQNDQLRKYSDQLKKQYVAMNDKNKQMKMLAQATPVISFHTAAASGSVDQIHELLETGIDVNGRNAEGKTALHTAATSSQGSVCSLLLHAKADPNAADIDGKAPIHLACRNGDTENARLLIEFGADVNAMDRDGRTPLHVAATNGHPELCKLLLESDKEAEIDVNQTDLYGQTPMSMAKLNDHQDVFTVLKEAGGALPSGTEHHQLTDKSDSTSDDTLVTKQIPMLKRMIQSLFHLLSILITKIEITSNFPDIKEKIDQLKLASENLTSNYDERKLASLQHTIEDLFDMEQWANQTHHQGANQTPPQGANATPHQVQSASSDETAQVFELKRKLSQVGSELTKVRNQLEQECKENADLKEENTNQLSEISKLRTDAENVDLYSATNLEEEEGELYDIARLFQKVSIVEKNAKVLCALADRQVKNEKGHQVQLPQQRHMQLQRTRQASSLPNPQSNQAAGIPRKAASLNENGTAKNILQMHDIRLPPEDHDRSQQAQIVVPQRPQQAGFHQPVGPASPRRPEIMIGRQQRNDSWEDLSRSAESRRHSSSNRAPGSAFVPRSPEAPNRPFDSVRGPPGFEYSNTQTPISNRYVEGASQQHIFEDGIPTSPRRNSDGRYMNNSGQAQNIYPVSCSDERQAIGSRDQIVVPGGRAPEEGTWNDRRDEIVTGHEQVNQLAYDQGAVNGQQQFPREVPATKPMTCPVCGREFAPGTPEDNMSAHVNRHFDGSAPQGGNVDGFEVLPST